MDTSRISVPAAMLATDLRRAIRMARDLGARGVELDARHSLDAAAMSRTGLRQIRKLLGDEGVVVSAIAFHTRGGYADTDRLEGRIAATKDALRLAHDLGAGLVLNHVGEIPADSSGPQWQLLVDVLTDLAQFGEHVGAMLCAEAGRAGPADLARLLTALPDGGLVCDLVTGALVVHGHDPVTAIESLGSHVASVHATDAIAGPFAGRGRAVVLGTGQVDLPGVLAALEQRGYRGWIGIEPVDERDARAELADAIAHLAVV